MPLTLLYRLYASHAYGRTIEDIDADSMGAIAPLPNSCGDDTLLFPTGILLGQFFETETVE